MQTDPQDRTAARDRCQSTYLAGNYRPNPWRLTAGKKDVIGREYSLLSFDPLSPKFIFDQSAAFRHHFDIADLGEEAFQKPLPNTWLVRVTLIALRPLAESSLVAWEIGSSALTSILRFGIVHVSIASHSWLMLCTRYNLSF
jgi:hypothetical protein